MLQIFPDYYQTFTCTADQCPITCCQEWKISVDEETNKKWSVIQPPADVLPFKHTLSDYTKLQEEIRIISLNEQKKCPFLKENGLCRLVLAHGEEILSETCTTFPRETKMFSRHQEKSLMPACPAVIDLWQKSPELSFPQVPSHLYETPTRFLFEIRGNMIHMVQNSADSPEHILLECFYILLELQHTGISADILSDYFSVNTLQQLSAAIDAMNFSLEDMFLECNELLQDLAVNYQKEGLYERFLTPVLTLAEQISNQKIADNPQNYWYLFQKQFTGYQPLIRNFLANEFFSDLLSPDDTLDDMIVQMQWIGMEYAVIRHAVFLKWYLEDRQPLRYDMVRDYLVILTRMTGYEKEDIYEYLENSFDSLFWDWGYFAIIVSDLSFDY